MRNFGSGGKIWGRFNDFAKADMKRDCDTGLGETALKTPSHCFSIANKNKETKSEI